MKTFLTFLINKCQYKTSYLIFAAEIKINIKHTTAFFNAMQTSCIKNRCMMDVLKVILFCSWGWSTRCARFDFDKCHNLSKRNVKLILKILSDLEPLRGSSNKKTLYSIRLCVNWAFLSLVGLVSLAF
jgi:hypothetical protein